VSSYFYIYQQLQQAQYEIVTILGAMGAVWGVAWLWIWRRVPARWRVWVQWAYIILAIGLAGYALASIQGV
jgi:hypothetical protein